MHHIIISPESQMTYVSYYIIKIEWLKYGSAPGDSVRVKRSRRDPDGYPERANAWPGQVVPRLSRPIQSLAGQNRRFPSRQRPQQVKRTSYIVKI